MKSISIAILNTALVLAISAMFPQSSDAQRRDHLTKEEVELVRDVQDVDLRMKLFVRAIERRLWVLAGVKNLTGSQKKQVEKELEKWGELPEGSRVELLTDIEKILDESIDKFEDVYEREPKAELLPFAYYILADFCDKLIPELKAIGGSTTDKGQISRLERAADHCVNILEARDKIARPTGKRPKSQTNE